jgi:hypothetical protein
MNESSIESEKKICHISVERKRVVPFLFLIQEQWRNYRPGKIETDLIVVPATRMWLSDCNQCCFCVSKYLLYVALSWQRNIAVFAFVF